MRVKRNFLPSGDQDRCWIKSPILETRTGGGSSDWAQVRPKPVDGSTAARSQTPCRNGLRMISCSSFPTFPRFSLAYHIPCARFTTKYPEKAGDIRPWLGWSTENLYAAARNCVQQAAPPERSTGWGKESARHGCARTWVGYCGWTEQGHVALEPLR